MNTHPPHAESHVVRYGTYLLVWAGLLALTGLTVSLAGIDLGRWIIVVTLLIAAGKSFLVLSIFMHLKFEDRMFRIFLLVALATLAIFLLLTFADYAFH
jgi:cytochrome c oxidase subunit IV